MKKGEIADLMMRAEIAIQALMHTVAFGESMSDSQRRRYDEILSQMRRAIEAHQKGEWE